jgi:carbon starvation protein
MARILDDAARNLLHLASNSLDALSGMMKYWYHFAIMFEALFILTTIDTGTRVGRFLLQETLGKYVHPKLGQTHYWPSALLATALMVAGWWYFLSANAMQAIWPMFGIANQMLAVMALAVGSTALARNGKSRYLWVTLIPMCFVILTTTSAAAYMLKSYCIVITTPNAPADKMTTAIVSSLCILAITICTALVVIASITSLSKPPTEKDPLPVPSEPDFESA